MLRCNVCVCVCVAYDVTEPLFLLIMVAITVICWSLEGLLAVTHKSDDLLEPVQLLLSVYLLIQQVSFPFDDGTVVCIGWSNTGLWSSE